LPKEQKYFDRESSKKKADRFHELFKLREFYPPGGLAKLV